ncbi:hypothetical protein DL95DRAFT_527740 [Leptodontidium sp. 2 PMI_412]|nr:hypothetical protein DL95DRAFT_527740 [Leptodontidium sp. 2 PMI_412]
MSVLDRLKQSPAVVTDGVQPTSTPSRPDVNPTTGREYQRRQAIASTAHPWVDLEVQKPIGVDIKLGEQGAQRIELMQQVWENIARNISSQHLDLHDRLSSDRYGRAAIYPVALGFVALRLALAVSAKRFRQFSLGTVLRVWGITALNTLNTTVIADITTTRQRGFGVNFQFFTYLILPWVLAFIVSDIRRAKKIEAALFQRPRMTISEAAPAIDLGGLMIIIFAFAFILIILSLATLQPQGFKTPWIIALIVLGGVLLLGLPVYEKYIPEQPFVPWDWLKHRSIGLAILLYFSDYMAAAASHNFIYNWALIAHNFTIVQAVNLSYISSVIVFGKGMLFGLVMWKMKQYKWWIMGGANHPNYWIWCHVPRMNCQPKQTRAVHRAASSFHRGLGNGIVQTGGYVAAVVNAPHRAIYTNTFRDELAKALGDNSTPELIDALFNSITSTLIPTWGTFDKVTSYFFIAAMAIIVPCFPTICDGQNLIGENGTLDGKIDLMHRAATADGHPSVPEVNAETKEVK